MKKSKAGIVGKVAIVLCVIFAIFTGGYFFLDKLIVPKYFGKYGIYGVGDLVGTVASLYKSPKESKIVTNGYTQTDFTNAISKLQNANYQINDDGTITVVGFENIKGDAEVVLTDREFASVCSRLVEDGFLVDMLPNLNYLNIINMSILELVITPEEGSETKSNISFLTKIETVDIREQIATQMDTPLFLLNMIIPDVLYFSVSYDIDLEKSEEERVSNGSIAINGRSAKQSKILIDLLVDFIFPAEEGMDLNKFTTTFGNIILEGIDVFGSFRFVSNIGTNSLQNGIVVNPLI
ncbi:MAG: hypothetical protein IKB06_05005 [Clostridia bacterium]|nr:hypothetical protein [Clostridia bacterium]